jgi:hypothetical protein
MDARSGNVALLEETGRSWKRDTMRFARLCGCWVVVSWVRRKVRREGELFAVSWAWAKTWVSSSLPQMRSMRMEGMDILGEWLGGWMARIGSDGEDDEREGRLFDE